MTPSLTTTTENRPNPAPQENPASEFDPSEVPAEPNRPNCNHPEPPDGVEPNSLSAQNGPTTGSTVQNPVHNLRDLNSNRPSPIASRTYRNRNFLFPPHVRLVSTSNRNRSESEGPLGDFTDTEDSGEEDAQHRPSSVGAARFGKTYRPERLKTLVAFVCVCFSAFVNFSLLTVIHDITPRTPLPDLAFMVLPQQGWASFVADVLSALSVIVAFSCILLHKYRWTLFRRACLISAVLYLLRGVCLGVTFMPPSFRNPASICIPSVNGSTQVETILERLTEYLLTFGLTSGQEKILCGDLMFSGHTVILTLMYFMVLQYTPHKAWHLRWLMAPICYFGLITVVISGGHYTIDVLVAYWISSHLFWSYHQVFELPKRLTHRRKRRTGLRRKFVVHLGQPVERRRRNAPVTRLWWYWIAVWFECNVPDGCLPNDLCWPLPWPVYCVKIVEKLSIKLNE